MAKYDDDDDDDMPVKKKELSGLDAFFANTNMFLLILFACCCSGIATIVGIIGLVTCKDAKAKSNAMIVTIVGAILTVLGIIAQVMSAVMGPQGGGRKF
jgi:hypothetical protein